MSRLEREGPEKEKPKKIVFAQSMVSHLSTGKDGIAPLISLPRKKEWSDLSPMDIIAPENFTRIQLDRHFFDINQIFLEALGPARTPLQSAVDVARKDGAVKLLDVGCGTGNTLRTWRDVIANRAHCNKDNIEMTGISLHDYRQESSSAKTIQAHAEGKIKYLVGDATKKIDVPDKSVDVSLAYGSLIHIQNAVEVVNEMMRVTKENGVLYLDFRADQNTSVSPEMELLYDLDDQGHTTDIKPLLVKERGRQQIRTFCIVEKNPAV